MVIAGTDAVVFAVRHKDYHDLVPERWLEMTGRPVANVDCFFILDG